MSRILMFPEPFPDEDFRSIIFRYHVRSANADFSESKFELFGTTSYKQTVFPRRLNYLLGKLPIGSTLSKELLLYNHTWYGLYKVFYMPERFNRTLKIINGESGRKSEFDGFSHRMAQSILSKDIKYCPVCVNEDEEMYGEAYVHRGDQIDFLISCPQHNVLLENKCAECGEAYAHSESGILLRSKYCGCGSKMKIVRVGSSGEIVKFQCEIYNDLVILRERHLDVNVDILYHQLIGYLYREKYIGITGKIHKKILIKDFLTHYSIEKLNGINISKDNISTNHFRTQFLNRVSMSNFIGFYLLLIRFLESSLQKFFLAKTEISSKIFFGNGPWTCRNTDCVNYNIPLIKMCVRKIDNCEDELGKLKYSCDLCGYATLLRGNINGDYCSTTYKDKYERKVSSVDNNSRIIVTVGEKKRLHERRKEIIRILDKGVDTRKKIRQENEAVYTWLMKYDRTWLLARLPPEIDKKARKVDFAQLDNELLIKIKNAAKNINPNYPYRITKQTVCNLLEATERNRLKTYRASLLPLSYQELEKYVESRKDFLIRSIPRFYSKLVNRGTTSMNIYLFKSATAAFYQVEAEENIEIEREIIKFLEERNALIK